MANVVVTEYADYAHENPSKGAQCAKAPILASQVIAIGGTSAAMTNAANASTSLLYVFAEADCYVSFGTSPTASAANGHALAAGQGDYFKIPVGQSYKVACLERTV